MKRKIDVHLNKVKGKLDKFFNECVSTGRAYTILRSDHQRDLDMAVRECGFKYLRFHGFLQDDLGVYREDAEGNSIYSWQYADAVYDYILSIGMRPFVVFDFMPEALASGTKTIYWEKANITPPNNYAKWEMLVHEAVKHFENRYGHDEVKQWLFEVWNEPDNADYFFDGDINDYFKLYDSTVRGVKSVSEDYRIGGPAIAGDLKWIDGLIDHCSKNNIPIDFISSHTYSVKGFEDKSKIDDKRPNNTKNNPFNPVRLPLWKPGTPWQLGNLCFDPDCCVRNVKAAADTVRNSEMPNLDVYFTEWGLTYDYWDPMRDSYQAASYILSRLKRMQGYVKCMSYCEISDVFEEDGPPTDNFHGGFGLVNLQGIRKPAFFAYKFLNKLGNIELKCEDSDTFACIDDNGGIQVLFWDSSALQDAENKEYFNYDTPPKCTNNVKLSISGLKAEKYVLKVYCVGYRQNDAYSAYIGMEKPNGSLSREQVEILKNESSGGPIKTEIINVSENDFELNFDVRDNDVYLITLESI